jgi:putative serine protease PepD
VGWVAHEMNLRKRSRAIVAAGLAAAVVIGAGAGAGTYELLSDHAMTVGGIYEVAHRGVVEITATATPPPPFAQEEEQAQGSGWVYDRKGDIVTNQHVVAGADTLSVRFWNGMTYPATVIGSDRSIDLAVIKVQASSSELHPLQVGDSDALHVGDVVVAIGSPYGLEGTVTSGIISAVHRELKNENDVEVSDLVQTDAAINHGSSGSPLLNAKGHMIGVNGVGAQIERDSLGSDGVAFAIPAKTVASIVPRLIHGG